MTTVTLIGPGAIGCAVVGALVGRDDVDVTIAARTGFERLVVEGPPETVDHAVEVRTDPATITAPADVVLLATKVHQTLEAAAWLTAACGDQTTVAVLQNGISHRERVAPMVGGATVVPAIIFLPADRHEPGRVSMSLPASLRVADDDGGRRIADLFAGTYIDIGVEDDLHTVAWSKLASNCGIGVVTTLTRTDPSVLADPEVRATAARVIEETVAVAVADGAALGPGLAESIIDITLSRAPGHMTSQTVDRLAGRPTEWDARQQEVIRRADRHGVEVPTLRMLTALLRAGEPDGVSPPTAPA